MADPLSSDIYSSRLVQETSDQVNQQGADILGRKYTNNGVEASLSTTQTVETLAKRSISVSASTQADEPSINSTFLQKACWPLYPFSKLLSLEVEEHLKRNYPSIPSCSTATLTAYDSRRDFYCNVLPYEHNVYRPLSVEHLPHFPNINASFIQLDENQYVAGSAPVIPWNDPHHNNLRALFLTLIAGDSNTIVTLTNDIEQKNGKPIQKSLNYWDREFLFDDGIKLSCREVKTIQHDTMEKLVEREFTLFIPHEDSTKSQEHKVRQLHYQNLKDFGVPADKKLWLDLNREIDSAKGVVFYHCSAGLGRTGIAILTRALVAAMIQQIARGVTDPTISPEHYLLQMRQQRSGMIQDVNQFIAAVKLAAHIVITKVNIVL